MFTTILEKKIGNSKRVNFRLNKIFQNQQFFLIFFGDLDRIEHVKFRN
jgi:hypothetical protein